MSMLKFAALTPHPPIIIPEIGESQIIKVKKTIKAMGKLSKMPALKSCQTLIVISPHGLIYPDRINICGMPDLAGDLSQFGLGEVNFRFKNDLALAGKIDAQAEKNGLQTLLYDNGNNRFELDHGTLVPLYYLSKNMDKPEIVPIAYSYQDKATHFAFGEVIYEVISQTKKNIGLIASGDLSHRLIQSAPAGYSEKGKEFDKLLINYLKEKDIQGILEMDDDFIEEAGECGYKSILVLLGAINKLNWQPEILSYEGPFGVGYAIINFKTHTF